MASWAESSGLGTLSRRCRCRHRLGESLDGFTKLLGTVSGCCEAAPNRTPREQTVLPGKIPDGLFERRHGLGSEEPIRITNNVSSAMFKWLGVT